MNNDNKVGMEAACVVINKMFRMRNDEFMDCFGRERSSLDLATINPYDLKLYFEILKEYEKETDFKEGDEVYCEEFMEKGIITKSRKNRIVVLMEDGDMGYFKKTELKKTGRNINIGEILKELKITKLEIKNEQYV